MKKYKFDKKTEEILSKLALPLAVYQFIDKRVVTVLLSDSFCDLFGFKNKSEAINAMDNDMYEATHSDDKARIANEAYRFATEGGKYEVTYRTLDKSRKQYIIVHAVGKHVYTEDGVRLAYVWYMDEGIFSAKDETHSSPLSSTLSKAIREESIINTIRYDSLTGLPSMTYFFELAEEWRNNRISEGKNVALLFTDLCGMKFFNRKYGFAEGDKLLRKFADLLKKYFSNENCSRFGSDHFCIFTEPDGIEDKLKKIFKEFNSDMSLPVHAGIYLDETGLYEISAECDRAKYACDALGNNYMSTFKYFSSDMQKQVENRNYAIDNLDRALSEGWIQVYHQPIVRSANGRVSDEEALARWIDPEKGILMPSEFIPALEEANLIYKLDLYIVDQIIDKIKKQQKEGLYVVPESVNLSRTDFDMCDIVDEICKRIDKAGISRNKINIEVTESSVGQDFEYMKEQIERFRSLGFNVWLDDFGSGYSSLDVLQSLPVDLIKFDMRFMKDFDNGNESRIMLTELMRMAIALGIDTVCEGVETKEQANFLRDIGCTMIQGYYFCRPIPMEEIFDRYKKGVQIGFENPEESDYYASIGKINLYDLAILSNEDQEAFEHYFNTIPMAIFESNSDSVLLMRCNNTCKEFLNKTVGNLPMGARVNYSFFDNKTALRLINAVKECGESGNKLLLDIEMPDGSDYHIILKRIAINPVKGTKAIVMAVLAFSDTENTPITFSQIAKAFFSDFTRVYYVNLLTGKYVKYSSDFLTGEFKDKSRGMNYFKKIRKETLSRIREDDKEKFIEFFTKDNIKNQIEKTGVFRFGYHLKGAEELDCAYIKALRIKEKSRHIIIGFTDPGAGGES